MEPPQHFASNSHHRSRGVENENIAVTLQEPELWDKFHLLINEMIVTKNGRRMFPVIKASVTGLDPATFYTILLEFKQIDNNRYKYINGEWHPGTKCFNLGFFSGMKKGTFFTNFLIDLQVAKPSRLLKLQFTLIPTLPITAAIGARSPSVLPRSN